MFLGQRFVFDIKYNMCFWILLLISSPPLLYSLCGVCLLKLEVALATKPQSDLSHVCLLLRQPREGKCQQRRTYVAYRLTIW